MESRGKEAHPPLYKLDTTFDRIMSEIEGTEHEIPGQERTDVR